MCLIACWPMDPGLQEAEALLFVIVCECVCVCHCMLAMVLGPPWIACRKDKLSVVCVSLCVCVIACWP